jgi:hypothetical protein
LEKYVGQKIIFSILIGFLSLVLCKASSCCAADEDLSLHVGIKQAKGLSNATLNGAYTMCEYGTDPDHWTGRMKLIFNGAGNFAWQQIADSNGDTSSGSGAYSVADDGELTIDGQDAKGIVSADGNIFTLVDSDATDEDLSLHIGVKQSTGLSNSTLSGTYTMCEYGTDPEPWAGRIELTFDGSGNFTWQQIADSNGDTNSGSGTYSVASDGEITIIGRDTTGMVSADGNIFSLVDTNAADEDLSFHLGIKQPTGLSKSTLNGIYTMCEYGTDPDRWTGRIELSFDGSGNFTWQQISDSNGGTESGSGSYAIKDDGELTINGRGMKGMVNFDGNAFTLVSEANKGIRNSHLPLLLLGD